MEFKIKTFWQYVSENIYDVNYNNINKNTSIYNQILFLYNKINPDIILYFNINKIHINNSITHMFNGLIRYELILSANGKIINFPLIEQIYQISKNYKFPDNWNIIKYYPRHISPIIEIKFKNMILNQNDINYAIREKENNKIEVIFTVSDKITNNYINSFFDVYSLQNECDKLLKYIVGEFILASYFSLTILTPETVYSIDYPNENFKQLKYIEYDLQKLLPKFNKCELCYLNENHSDFIEKKYCLYCYNYLYKLNNMFK